jgi:hypothetical protein
MLLHVEGEVPFGDCLRWWIERSRESRGQPIQHVSHHFDRPYLAWETVRLARNPYFAQGTGFEGYFVGLCSSPDEALTQVLDVGRRALASINRLYRFEANYRRLLLRTLHGEASDLRAIAEWSVELGAILGILRCNVYRSPQAEYFRRETYQLLEGLPPIRYEDDRHAVRQAYEIRALDGEPFQRLLVEPRQLSTGDQEAWAVAAALGRFGHPLIREAAAAQR